MYPRHLSSLMRRIVDHRRQNGYSVFRRIVALLVILFAGWALYTSLSQLTAHQHALDVEINQLQATLPIDSARIGELQSQRITLANLSRPALVLASLSYLAALVVSAVFWWNCLRAFRQPARLSTTVASHILGQIGKYIPGKAMVIVIRTMAISRHDKVAKLPAVLGVFIETLTMMACGATWAGLAILFLPVPAWLRVLAFLLAIAAAIPTAPPLFRPLLQRIARNRFLQHTQLAVDDYNWRLTAQGWGWMSAVWLLIAVSYWCVVQATPGVGNSTAGLTGFATTSATIALAMIAGFLSMIPGGAGVREVVILGILAPVTGAGPAMVAAIIARLLFLVLEMFASASAWFYLKAKQ
jgi:uncharacterized membrane protein YbhN (UPF0104 family)